jgi:hypothetical protein
MTKKDKSEFILYLKACTLPQVRGVYEKERAAKRKAYAALAANELRNRGIEP